MAYEECTVVGRNAVMEAYRSGKTIDKLFILDGCQDGPVRTIAREARKHDTIVKFVPKERLDSMSETGAHQGVIAQVAAYDYSTVEDILKTIDELKEKGIWFVCADMDGEVMYRQNLTGPIGLVIGNEGNGVSRLVKEKCDFTTAIPMNGDIDSLNASVAAGVLAFEIVRQRMAK